MKSIAVFCGSSQGIKKEYMKQAENLGAILAKKGIELVYGGACVGLMGAVADAALGSGGKVTGVMPYFLESKEIAHSGLSRLILVESMHERKTKMNELSDGIIALPGGFGTLEEFFETLTWSQLGLHKKPMGILNIQGYYDPLISMIDKMAEEGFLKDIFREMLLVCNTIDGLLEKMGDYRAPEVGKWIAPQTT